MGTASVSTKAWFVVVFLKESIYFLKLLFDLLACQRI